MEEMHLLDKKRAVGLLGVVMLAAGAFSPVFGIPGGSVTTFFESGKFDGLALVCLSILSAIFLFARNYRALLFTGIGAIAIIVNMLAYFQAQIKGFSIAYATAERLPLTGRTGLELQWGWTVLLIGAILLVACPLMRESPVSDPPAVTLVTRKTGGLNDV